MTYKEGLKESSNKEMMFEIDASFILEMGKIMTINKQKYPRGNHYNKMDVVLLLEALERHFLKLKKDWQLNEIRDTKDPEDDQSEICKIALNAMMIWIQLNNTKTQ